MCELGNGNIALLMAKTGSIPGGVDSKDKALEGSLFGSKIRYACINIALAALPLEFEFRTNFNVSSIFNVYC